MDVVKGRLGVGGAIALCASSLALAPGAGAQTTAASCTTPVEVTRDQHVAGLSLAKGRYKVTVLDSRRLGCPDAGKRLRSLLETGKLPAGWRGNPATLSFRGQGEGFRLTRETPGGGGVSPPNVAGWGRGGVPVLFLGAGRGGAGGDPRG